MKDTVKINLLINLVKNGKMELSQVPLPYQEAVKQALEAVDNNG